VAAPVIFDHVSKKFRRGERHDSLRDFFPSLVRSVVKRRPAGELEGDREFWAVRDVSFEVQSGEAMGIIGPNGAGKSTTLKLLTRILRPTTGSCHVTGRVGALIEVAAGFHPDLTGRENVYLQGAIMGMKRAEIARHLDEIVEFAGVSTFIDTPVKRYSSGMNARLGFSIAAHLDPEVLIIDEVLSVGDMTFQERCIERMKEFKRSGVTIVFVSHNLQAVAELCDRTLVLNHSVTALTETPKAIEAYVRRSLQEKAPQTSDVRIVSTKLVNAAGREVHDAAPGDALKLVVNYTAVKPYRDLQFGFLVHRSTDGLMVYDESVPQVDVGLPPTIEAGEFTIAFDFKAHLTRGQYQIELHVYHSPTHVFLTRLRPAELFSVSETKTFAGVADLDVRARAMGDALGKPTLVTADQRRGS
jgi:lipopolysaccharide transport system ATP-binding protein